MQRPNISIFISRLTISLVLLTVCATSATAQKLFRLEKDSIPMMQGFQVSFDLFGFGLLQLSEY